MKSKHLLLMLLLALMAPWAANAQEQYHTVYDQGTLTTSANVPIYGTWADAYTKAEFVMPANDATYSLSVMKDATITKMKFYVASVGSGGSGWSGNTFQVFMKEIENTTISSYQGTDGATIVYEGPLTAPTGAGEFEIVFTTGYEYNGGNLLIGIYDLTDSSSDGYKTVNFNGKSVSGAAVYGYSSSSLSAVTTNTTGFIPKTTFTYEPASSCEKPATLVADPVTHNSATLTWSGGSGTYNVEVKGGAWTDWTEILHETTLTTTNLNLQPITAYQARVQSVCTGENSGWKSTSFATECGPVGIGYQCGFEGPNTGGTPSYPLPACWTRITEQSTPYPYVYAYGTPRTDSYHLYFYSSSTPSAQEIAILPEIEGGVNGKRLSFYQKGAYSFSVGYMTDPDDASTFEAVYTQTGSSSYALHEVDFTGIASGVKYMAIKSNFTSTYCAIYFDDLELQETPPCADMQVQASTITATATAYNAATVTWTGAGAATQWKVQCSQDNTFATVDKEVVANTTTANITGLTAEKTYYVRIAPFCTENSEYNPWSSNKSFSTPVSCPAPVLAAATNPTAHGATFTWTGTSETYNLMRCTPEYQTGGITEGFENGLGEWEKRNCASSTGISTTTSHENSGNSFRFYYNTNPPQYLISPELTGIEAGTVQFYYRKTESMSETFKVGYSTTTKETSAFGNWSEEQSASTSWQLFSMDIPAGTKYVCIQYTANDHYYLYIDDITIGNPQTIPATPWQTVETGITANTVTVSDDTKFDAETKYQVKVVGICPWTSEETESNIISFTTTSSCETPSNLQESEVTANSAKITWNTHGLTNFNLRYSSDGGSSWTTVENVSSPYTFPDNLTANKEYQVQAQGICTSGTTEWSVALVFWTECDDFTVDMQHSFAEYFDESTFPRCWDNPVEVINSSNRQWTRANLNHTATSGSGSAFSNYYGPIYLMMPDLAIANGTTDVKLNFWARLDYTGDYDGTTAKSSVVLIDGNTETELWTYDDVANITDLEDLWKDYSINLSAYKGQTISLAFKYVGTNDHGWYIDDVEVVFDPTCFPVSNLSYSDVTNHSATITWNKGTADQDTWQVKYNRDADFDPDIEGEAIPGGKCYDTTYTFVKTLFATSHYYVYVRANCGDVDGPSTWVKTDFTTLGIAPAPSAFTASNFASTKVDLVWTAGGGDYEDSWDLYYVPSTTAPEAPTNETVATKTVTTLPTALAPYQLTGLTAETRYYIWVRANHGSDKSAWVALTGDYFETLASCPTPTGLAVANITSVSADLSWVGSTDVDDYTIEYGEEGTYSLNETEDFSAYTATTYDAAGSLPEGWKGYSTGLYKPHVSNNSVLGGSYDLEGFAGGQSSDNNFLYMIGNSTGTNSSYTILPQFSDLTAVSFDYGMEDASRGTLTVGYCTDNADGSTFTPFDDLTLTGSINSVTVNLTATDIALLNANNGYLTFRWVFSSGYGVGIDNITIKGGTYTPGDVETETTDEQQITLTGLTPNKTYTAKVKSNCTSAEWSATINFTTLAEGNKVFVTEGNWNTAANWVPAGAPAITDDAIIRANVTIPNGTVATAKKINFEGATTPTLTIADGGQLQTNTAVTATVKKNITGYGDAGVGTNNGYYLIANPINTSIGNATTYGMATSDGLYDLYQFNANPGASDSLEWRNYKASSFYIANGKGYLYANKNDVELTFTGNVRANNEAVGFGATFTGDWQFKGWNLFGNPFVCNAYLVSAATGGTALPYYKMNADGNNITAKITTSEAIAPMEGIFYEASATTNVYFARTAPETSTGPKGNLNILVSNSNTRGSSVIDNAIISFGNPNTLGKLNLFACDARVFIPQDGKDYAVAYAESNVGEMPLNFKAEKNGAYTLSFTAEEVGFSYLHLIDNMTGADIDLLAGASTGSATYTFNAKTTDYASRFRLVFATGSSVEDDNFGFINGSGNLCIFGIEGTATLQVIDVTGRILSSETFSGSYEKGLNAAPGVYVMRLINGNEVKTQKIVVR